MSQDKNVEVHFREHFSINQCVHSIAQVVVASYVVEHNTEILTDVHEPFRRNSDFILLF